MPSRLTVDDIVPLIAARTPHERIRLLRLIARPQSPLVPSDDASLYHAMPPNNGEFSADEEPLAWEGDEWEGGLKRGEIRWYTFRLPDKRRPREPYVDWPPR